MSTTTGVALFVADFATSAIVVAAVVSGGPVRETIDSAAEIDLTGALDLEVGAPMTAQTDGETAPKTIEIISAVSAAIAKHHHHHRCPTMAITINQRRNNSLETLASTKLNVFWIRQRRITKRR